MTVWLFHVCYLKTSITTSQSCISFLNFHVHPQCLCVPRSWVWSARAPQTLSWIGSRCPPRWAGAACPHTDCPIARQRTALSRLWSCRRTAPNICWRACSLTPSTCSVWPQPRVWAGASPPRGPRTARPRPPAAKVNRQEGRDRNVSGLHRAAWFTYISAVSWIIEFIRTG